MMHLQLLNCISGEFLNSQVEVLVLLLGITHLLAGRQDLHVEVGQLAVYQKSNAAFEFAHSSALLLAAFVLLRAFLSFKKL
jgi:hypothetical protein